MKLLKPPREHQHLLEAAAVGAALPRETSSSFPKVPEQKQQICLILGNLENFAPSTCYPWLCCPTSNLTGEKKGKSSSRDFGQTKPSSPCSAGTF